MKTFSEHINPEQLAEVLPFDPTGNPPDEGFFVPEWLRFDTTVVDVQPYQDVKVVKGGEFTFDKYTMSDGTQYHVMEGHPDLQCSEIPVDSTTAWCTQPDDGHNAITDEGLVLMGFRTRRVGPERFTHPGGVTPSSLYEAWIKGWNVTLG